MLLEFTKGAKSPTMEDVDVDVACGVACGVDFDFGVCIDWLELDFFALGGAGAGGGGGEGVFLVLLLPLLSSLSLLSSTIISIVGSWLFLLIAGVADFAAAPSEARRIFNEGRAKRASKANLVN